jgi:CRP/FNR family transcriptional regulator
VPVFAGLTPAEQLDVARLARPVRLHDGERLYGPGDPRPRLAVVHRGRLRVSRPTADGRDRVLRVVGPGEVVGEVEVLTGRAPTDLVRALGETRVCAFRPGDLDELLGHSSVARAAIRALAERLARSDEATAVAGASPVVARLAAYLLAQPRAGAPGREVLRLPLARTDIASLLGTTPESLSRALRTLRDAGAVEGGRGRVLVLLDTGHLEELARR